MAVRDAWYIRLPNGQELRAKTTKAVSHHIEAGVIPKNSFVRRSHGEEWTLLEWTAEFAEILADRPKRGNQENGYHQLPVQSGLASRLDPMRLHTVGIRGLWDDLLAALDIAMSGGKPMVAGWAGAVIGLILIVLPWIIMNVFLAVGLADEHSVPYAWPARIVTWAAGALALGVVAVANGLLARMTHSEMCEMRPVGVREIAASSGRIIRRLATSYLVVVGGAVLLIHGVRWLCAAITARAAAQGLTSESWELAIIGLSIVGLVMEVGLWCVIGLSGLIAPILVVEEVTSFRGIAIWIGILRERLSRLLLAEALALGLGSLAALPFALPVYLAADHYPGLPAAAQNLAYGIALAPLTAFMAVANMFIFLDLRYEKAT